MRPNLSDPRVRKTRLAMRTAFFILLDQKGYDSISIQDIADEADIARITFYRHFHDKEEILEDCLNSLFDEILQRTIFEDEKGNISHITPTQILFEHLNDNEKFYKILFSSRGGEAATDRLRKYLVEKIVHKLEMVINKDHPDIPAELIANHLVSAQIGLGIWWLKNDKPYSLAYMVEITNWLTFAGAYRSLGFADFQLPVPILQNQDNQTEDR